MKLLGHDQHTLTGVYALDAVDVAERERFERHLNRCQSCEHEVRGLQETAGRLAFAVTRVPPPGLKVAVMTAAARTRQHPPVVTARPEPSGPRAARPARSARHGRPARPAWRSRLALPVAALASAVAIALGVILGVQRGQLDQAHTQQRQVAAVLSAPDARLFTEATSRGGSTTVVVSEQLHRLVFTSSGLPGLPGSQVYQLWLITPAGGAISAGLLPHSSGGRTAPVLADGYVRGDRVGLTVEPAGGTRQPTTKPIVAMTVSS